MAVIRRPLGQGVVVLGGLLQELDVVLLDVVVGPASRVQSSYAVSTVVSRPDGILQLIVHNLSGPLGGCAAHERHDPGQQGGGGGVGGGGG